VALLPAVVDLRPAVPLRARRAPRRARGERVRVREVLRREVLVRVEGLLPRGGPEGQHGGAHALQPLAAACSAEGGGGRHVSARPRRAPCTVGVPQRGATRGEGRGMPGGISFSFLSTDLAVCVRARMW